MNAVKGIVAILIGPVLLLGTGGVAGEQQRLSLGFGLEETKAEAAQPSEVQPTENLASVPEGQNGCQGIGGTFLSYRKYTVEESAVSDRKIEVIERGEIGLTYTLKRVQVFHSFQDAAVDPYGLLFVDEAYFANNRFLLVDLEANYTAPPGGEPEIMADAGNLSGVYLRDGLAETEKYGMPPTLAYFSLRPKPDDPVLDEEQQFFFFRVKDGESVTFKVGIFCGEEYLNCGNVYLEITGTADAVDLDLQGDTERRLFSLVAHRTVEVSRK